MNLSANAAEDHNRSHQNKGRNKDGSSSANIYQRNHYQPEREMVPWIPQYDSDEQQHQNYFN